MNVSIQQLQEKLDELKKRLKAVNQSQNVMSQLITIRDYFDQIQEYLNNLNTAFNTHVISCDEHNQQILDLQEQFATINAKIDALPDLENYNLTQMAEDITNLSTNIQALSQELENIKGNSSTSLESLDTEISNINNSITTITAELETINSNISTNQADISTLKTDVSNLKTTQNNQASTQTTLTNNISTLNTKVTSLESEVAAITGGVDLTELEERLIQLELLSGPIFLHKEINNLNSKKSSSQSYWHSRRIHFSTVPQTVIGGSVTIKLKYLTNPTNTIKIDLFLNSVVHQSISCLPSQTEFEYTFPISYKTKNYFNHLWVRFNSDDEVILEGININLYGPNIKIAPYDNDLSVYCFNGYKYITRHYDNYIKYQKFLVEEDIDLDNLANTYYLSSDTNSYNRLYFIPYVYGVKNEEDSITYLSKTTDVLYAETTAGYVRLIKLEEDDVSIDLSLTNLMSEHACEVSTGVTSIMYRMIVDKDIIYHRELIYAYTGYKLSSDYGTFIDVVGEKRNFTTTQSQSEKINNICYIAKKIDGYFYIFKGITLSNPISIKLIKGNKATLFRQPDGSLNAYIVAGNVTYKYKITFTTDGDTTTINSELIATISNCDCVYETLNNQIIKHILKDSGEEWIVDTLEY